MLTSHENQTGCMGVCGRGRLELSHEAECSLRHVVCSPPRPPRDIHIYWYHRLCLTRALLAVLTSNKKWVKNTEGSSPDVLMTAVC